MFNPIGFVAGIGATPLAGSSGPSGTAPRPNGQMVQMIKAAKDRSEVFETADANYPAGAPQGVACASGPCAAAAEHVPSPFAWSGMTCVHGQPTGEYRFDDLDCSSKSPTLMCSTLQAS